MKRKQATLVVNPRAGQNLAKISDILAVLAAAGWKTKLALKEYGGHTMTLATEAAADDQDIVIAYGGDGTLNQVVNGVMHTQKHAGAVGLIPGGTANVWASEIGVPTDPVQAALTLINSEVQKVDVGHVEVEGLSLAKNADNEAAQPKKRTRKGQEKNAAKVRQHFLLMAGLGIDAAVMSHVSKPLKYKVGALAVGVSTAKELPEQHTFPVEIEARKGDNAAIHWQGEALQVIIGNTRLYADVVEMTPEAYIDDGILDVCVITAGNPLTTMQQIASLLFRHHPDNLTAEHFQGAHFSLKVPASIALQLDGSAVKLKDYLSKAERQELKRTNEAEQMMVTYHFDAMPRALPVAIPRTYNGVLFEASHSAENPQAEGTDKAPAQPETSDENEQKDEQHDEEHAEPMNQEELEHAQKLLEGGRKVSVLGVTANPAQKRTYIIAGTITKSSTGEAKPVAVCVSADTHLLRRTGEDFAPESLCHLRAGDVILVEGKKSKRGVITATRAVI